MIDHAAAQAALELQLDLDATLDVLGLRVRYEPCFTGCRVLRGDEVIWRGSPIAAWAWLDALAGEPCNDCDPPLAGCHAFDCAVAL